MKQVLGNLLSNALEAVAVDGTVRVRTALVGAGLCVSITDDGPGMDAETLARLHEPFHTTKARGTGLGIPLALRLAKAQGGQLTFSSQPGSGTVAVLHFPPPRKTNRRSLGAA
jgi:two-component system sensor histidine kinase FlrB